MPTPPPTAPAVAGLFRRSRSRSALPSPFFADSPPLLCWIHPRLPPIDPARGTVAGHGPVHRSSSRTSHLSWWPPPLLVIPRVTLASSSRYSSLDPTSATNWFPVALVFSARWFGTGGGDGLVGWCDDGAVVAVLGSDVGGMALNPGVSSFVYCGYGTVMRCTVKCSAPVFPSRQRMQCHATLRHPWQQDVRAAEIANLESV